MTRYLVVRLTHSLIALLIVATLVFIGVRLTGDPARVYVGDSPDPDLYERVQSDLGLDRPLVVQYGLYLRDAATGDFGTSWQQRKPVIEVIQGRLGATLQLAFLSFGIAGAVGMSLGTLAAVYHRTVVDRVVSAIAVFGQATPNFWLGLMLILLFAIQFDVLPAGGRGGWTHLVLPAITLSGFSLAAIARLTRSAVLEVLQNDYVRTARAKGLREGLVIRRHVLGNAMIPVVTLMGLQLAQLLQGAVVTEQVFSWPGIGQLAVTSVSGRDFPVVQGIVLGGAAVFLFLNLVVDLSYGWLDPRIRLGRG